MHLDRIHPKGREVRDAPAGATSIRPAHRTPVLDTQQGFGGADFSGRQDGKSCLEPILQSPIQALRDGSERPVGENDHTIRLTPGD
jgi:hypothetical protein